MTALRTAELTALIGTELGPTPWRQITQSDVDMFGRLVGDSQWIHVDQDKAAEFGGFGGTIVHGAYLISLATTFAGLLLPVADAAMIMNGGLASARLRRPVSVGSRVRGIASIAAVDDLGIATAVNVRVSVSSDNSNAVAATGTVRLVVHD